MIIVTSAGNVPFSSIFSISEIHLPSLVLVCRHELNYGGNDAPALMHNPNTRFLHPAVDLCTVVRYDLISRLRK